VLNRVGTAKCGPDPDVWNLIVPLARNRRFGAVAALIATALGLGMATGVAAPALADEEAPAIRWSVTPADESGPDGRSFVENTLDPGETVEDHLAVRNVSAQTVEFALTAADGFYTRSGRFDILASGEESVAAGTWIEIPQSVTVAAGETEVVPFSITVPENAEPGDHAAGITASVLSVQESEDGASVGVESRVGFRVTTRVTGELTPAAEIQNLSGGYALSWNPFRPGDLTVSFDVENTGNTILLAQGNVAAGGRDVDFPGPDEQPQELLRGDTRSLNVVVDDVWPLFLLPTTVTVAATVVTMEGEQSTLEPVTAEVLVWAVPWPQLMLLAGIALLILALVWGRRRSKKRLQGMLEQAREEGRRAADDDVKADAS
jgi:hypothetical protein